MSKLSVFLHPVSAAEEREVVVSDRFRNEDGQPAAFRIRALTQEENDEITCQSRKVKKVNGQVQESLDSVEFSRRMVVAATVEPDFRSKELCDAYHVLDPLLVPGKMLLAGEYARLLKEITKLSGFTDPAEDVKN